MKLMLYSLLLLVCSAVLIKAQLYSGPNVNFIRNKAVQPQIDELLARPDLTEEDKKTLQGIADGVQNDDCKSWVCAKQNIKAPFLQLAALRRKLNMQQAQVQQ